MSRGFTGTMRNRDGMQGMEAESAGDVHLSENNDQGGFDARA
jgi:hypothetical protein